MTENSAGGGSYAHSIASGGALSDEEDGSTDRKGSAAGDPSGTHQRILKSAIKRQRVHFSCTECHRRKQKCDRNTPCQHCIARKIPERCKTFQPGEDPNDLNARVARLERTMNDNFERMFTLLQNNGANGATLPNQQRSQREGVAAWRTQTLAAQAGPIGPSQAEGSEAGDEVVVLEGQSGPEHATYNMNAAPLATRVNTLMSNSVESGQKLPAPDMLIDPTRHIEAAAQLDAVMAEYGATYNVSPVLMAALPSRQLCDTLVDHFFAHNNWLRQPLSRKRFSTHYEAFWLSGPTLSIGNINLYAILVLSCAIGSFTYRGSMQISDDPKIIRLAAKRLFFAARQSLLISTMLGREDIEQVVAFHLASRFLFLDRRISEAWTCVANAVKTAHSIGLHRDPSLLGLPQSECEGRRRIWSNIYFSERILCMNLGRPTAIDDEVVDAQLISDEDVTGEFQEYMKPLPNAKAPKDLPLPRFLSFTRVRHQLGQIMGRVISTYQNVHTHAHYSDVVAIDNSLTDLQKALPDYLRTEFNIYGHLHHVNRAWDNVYEFVAAHRYLIQAEIHFLRRSLHRPYLIRPAKNSTKGNTSNRYHFSRRSCIDSAYRTLILRKDLSDFLISRLKEGEQMPTWVSHLGSYNTLHAIVILGIYLLMEPKAENAAMLMAPLRTFYDIYQKKKKTNYHFDEVREREFTILRMFVERIEDARERKDKRPRDATAGDEKGDKRVKRHDGSGGIDPTYRHMDGSGALVESPLSKEEDTAGVLLDLNQSGRRRVAAPGDPSSGATASALQSSSNEAAHPAADDGSMPWPYLPMQTPHHTHPNAKGSDSSPHTAGSSGSGNGRTPPMTSAASGSASGDDGVGGASLHQLFDSWFRYNAFENMDIDGANTSGIPSNGDERPTTARSGDQLPSVTSVSDMAANFPTSSSMSGMAEGPPSAIASQKASTSMGNGQQQPPGPSAFPFPMTPGGTNLAWNFGLHTNKVKTPLAPPPASSGMPLQWSSLSNAQDSNTLTSTLSNSNSNNTSVGRTTYRNSAALGASSTAVDPTVTGRSEDYLSSQVLPISAAALPTGPRGPGPTGVDFGVPSSDRVPSVSDASYDPLFWQR